MYLGDELKELNCGIASTTLKMFQVSAHGSRVNTRVGVPFSNMTMSQWSASVKLWLKHGVPLISSLKDRQCPVCDSSDRRVLFHSYDGYPFAECNDCKCWYIPKLINDELFEEYFLRSPEARKLADQMIIDRNQESIKKTDLERITEYLQELKELFEGEEIVYLDAGCGVGHSLVAARECGVQAVGVDTERTSIRVAKENGLEVYHVDEPVPENNYNLLTFWESLEHIPNPKQVISKYLKLLSEDGIVALTVPNLDSLAIRIQRGDCSYVHGGVNWPGHMNLFNEKCLRIMLEECGLEVLSVDAQYSDNLEDIASYLLGNNRGATDLITHESLNHGLSDVAHEILKSIGTVIAVLQRVTKTAPILKIIACRKGKRKYFDKVLESFENKRKKGIENMLQEIVLNFEGEKRAQHRSMARTIEELLGEVEKRDDLLMKTQQEVDRRDKLLSEAAEAYDNRERDVQNRLAELEEENRLIREGARSGRKIVRKIKGVWDKINR